MLWLAEIAAQHRIYVNTCLAKTQSIHRARSGFNAKCECRCHTFLLYTIFTGCGMNWAFYERSAVLSFTVQITGRLSLIFTCVKTTVSVTTLFVSLCVCVCSICRHCTCSHVTCWMCLGASASFRWTRWPTWRSSPLSTGWSRVSAWWSTPPSSTTISSSGTGVSPASGSHVFALDAFLFGFGLMQRPMWRLCFWKRLFSVVGSIIYLAVCLVLMYWNPANLLLFIFWPYQLGLDGRHSSDSMSTSPVPRKRSLWFLSRSLRNATYAEPKILLFLKSFSIGFWLSIKKKPCNQTL